MYRYLYIPIYCIVCITVFLALFGVIYHLIKVGWVISIKVRQKKKYCRQNNLYTTYAYPRARASVLPSNIGFGRSLHERAAESLRLTADRLLSLDQQVNRYILKSVQYQSCNSHYLVDPLQSIPNQDLLKTRIKMY